jgi:hypothetical protein
MAAHDRISDAGQHIRDRIIYAHDLTSTLLPGRLDDAGDLARQREFAETDTAQTEAADKTARTSAALTTIAHLHRVPAA